MSSQSQSTCRLWIAFVAVVGISVWSYLWMTRPKDEKRLVGQWWLYEEAHLSSRAAFSLHVMFDKSDVEIEAEGLEIERL